MTFKNLKIAITDDTHLKAVCEVLESMGYEAWNIGDYKTEMIVAWEDGRYSNFDEYETDKGYGYSFPTLSDLLKMRDDMVKANAKSC